MKNKYAIFKHFSEAISKKDEYKIPYAQIQKGEGEDRGPDPHP